MACPTEGTWPCSEQDQNVKSRRESRRLTFLSRKEAIRPKFLGCCMNLREQKDRVSASTNSDSAAGWVGGQLLKDLLIWEHTWCCSASQEDGKLIFSLTVELGL